MKTTWSEIERMESEQVCEKEINAVMECSTEEAQKASLQKTLGIDGSRSGRGSLALYFRILCFGIDQGFTAKQISKLLVIMKSVHEKTIVERLCSERSREHLFEQLCAHSIHRPPYSIGIWTPSQIRNIAEWIAAEYFTQFLLYQGICRKRETMNLTTRNPGDHVEKPIFIPPLEEALTEETYIKQLEDARILEKEKLKAKTRKEKEQRLQIELLTLPNETRRLIEEYIQEKIELSERNEF